ncbi:MAG: hypothetical protein MJY83_05430 [Bacteroidales bacterium]|nr:hypothetical protein [Bacteroidales bacterium]
MYQTSVENEAPKKKVSWIPWAIVTVVLVGAAVAFFSFKKGIDDTLATKSEQALSVETQAASEENLLGGYDVLLVSGDIENHFTAVIDQDEMGDLLLHIYSEYEPKVLRLEILEDGKISNEELGVGVMTYQKSIDKLSITFEKGNAKCVLSR